MTPEEILEDNKYPMQRWQGDWTEDDVIKMLHEYGKQQWNEAIKLAAEEATFDKKYVPSKVDKQSILKLLK